MTKSIKVHYLTEYDENGGNDLEQRKKVMNDHAQWYDRHLEDLLYEQKECLNYVLNTAGIFPYDLEKDEPTKDKVLRPELMCMYN